MEKVTIKLENCYGIKSLSHAFDFSSKHQNVLYAPNGVMKSSLAKVFQDRSNNKNSEDRVYPDRVTVNEIKDENGAEISPDKIFVIEPYVQGYKSEKVSTLLVNRTLKTEYESVYDEINSKKNLLMKHLSVLSGIKKNPDEILSFDIASDKNEFFRALTRLKSEVSDRESQNLSDIIYARIFSDKVASVLSSSEFKEKISAYMDVYDKLTSNSYFFKKGVFNHNNASDIAKNLKANGFFKASHSVYINSKDVKREINNESELEKVIQEEKNSIIENDELIASFEEIDKTLNKNAETRDFRAYLSDNNFLVPELENPERLKQRLWIAYLGKHYSEYSELLSTYEKGKERIEEIVESAKSEETKWKEVIDVFNSRFSVPFVVTMENQEDVILKSYAPSIKFRFKESGNSKEVPIEENKLSEILSNGERRALYILNIFEVSAREESGQETLFIFDDIADSFDYKNKYAIVEYLRDISTVAIFKQLILTHNFDFYRTLSGRLDLDRDHRLHALKTPTEIKIEKEVYQNNPFIHWKNNFKNNDSFMIAMIPFVRNLAEFCGKHDEMNRLTSCLHIKENTSSLTKKDLLDEYKKILVIDGSFSVQNDGDGIVSTIYDLADKACNSTSEAMDLEAKIILSIAIRLRAENYMINKINDKEFFSAITKNQTRMLSDRFEKDFPSEYAAIDIFRQVNLMTPENIHVNSFMYEPILDMSNDHLKRLNAQVKSLV